MKCAFEKMRFADAFVSVEVMPADGYVKGARRVQLRSPARRPVVWASVLPSRWYKDGLCWWFDAYSENDVREAFVGAQDAYFAGEIKLEGLPADWKFEQFDAMSVQDALTGFELFTSRDIVEPFDVSILMVHEKRQLIWDKARGGFKATGKGTYVCNVPALKDAVEPFKIAQAAYFAGEIDLGDISLIDW